MPVPRTKDPWPTLAAFGCLVAAVVLRALLDPILGAHLPLVTLFPAVALAAWWAGALPASIAAVVGYVVCDYLFIASAHHINPALAPRVIGIVAYLVSCSILVACIHAMRGAQREERETAERLRITLSSIGDAVLITDTDGVVRSMNRAAETLTGWARSEAIGRPSHDVFRLINELTREPAESPAGRALTEGIVVGLANHTLLIRRDGSEIPIEDSAAPIRDFDENVVGCVLVFRDASDRRSAEHAIEARLEAAQRLAAIVASSSDAIVGKSLDGTIRSWNAGAERLFGYIEAEAVGHNIRLIVPPDRFDEEASIVDRLARGEHVGHFETVRRRKDGALIDVSIAISPIFDSSGRVVGASKIARDIGSQKAADQAIRELMNEIQSANTRKDEFLAMLAHELRGPLAPVRHSLEILKRAALDAEVASNARSMIDRQTRHLERLVDDLLDVSRITRAKLELRTEELDLGVVLRQAAETARLLAEQRGQRLEVSLPDATLPMRGDPIRLAQVFGNLLHNASKFTEPGGRIELIAERRGDSVAVIVRDDGIGVRPEKLPMIFDLFAQLDDGPARPHGGLGIGLALVKRLTAMHQGTVEAWSEGPGRGTTMTVLLPLRTDAASAAPTRSEGRSEPTTTPHRILVVDDDVDSAESLSLLLEMLGHTTRRAHDGVTAVELAERFDPEVVLLDIGLPGLNGFDACRRIRASRGGGERLMIALTGWGQEHDRAASKAAGFDVHLVKPVDFDALTDLLARQSALRGGPES